METLQSAWFGLSEMGDLAHKIRDGGHELQLHLHPVWLIFDNDKWRETVIQQIPESRIHDSLAAVSSERACEIITRGLDVFKQWELPAPTAIRTGSLITERQLYRCSRTAVSTYLRPLGLVFTNRPIPSYIY